MGAVCPQPGAAEINENARRAQHLSLLGLKVTTADDELYVPCSYSELCKNNFHFLFWVLSSCPAQHFFQSLTQAFTDLLAFLGQASASDYGEAGDTIGLWEQLGISPTKRYCLGQLFWCKELIYMALLSTWLQMPKEHWSEISVTTLRLEIFLFSLENHLCFSILQCHSHFFGSSHFCTFN